jgi:hypothetical protein
VDYLPVTTSPIEDAGAEDGSAEDGGANEDGGVTETAEQVREDDIAALFAGMTGPTVRISRMRSDISHAAMTSDFILQASADQSELSNIRNVTQSINLTCPIYQDCQVVGQGTPAQAAASVATNGMGAGGGGCITSPRAARTPIVSYGALAGLVGIAVVRIGRSRKRGKRRETK